MANSNTENNRKKVINGKAAETWKPLECYTNSEHVDIIAAIVMFPL